MGFFGYYLLNLFADSRVNVVTANYFQSLNVTVIQSQNPNFIIKLLSQPVRLQQQFRL